MARDSLLLRHAGRASRGASHRRSRAATAATGPGRSTGHSAPDPATLDPVARNDRYRRTMASAHTCRIDPHAGPGGRRVGTHRVEEGAAFRTSIRQASHRLHITHRALLIPRRSPGSWAGIGRRRASADPIGSFLRTRAVAAVKTRETRYAMRIA